MNLVLVEWRREMEEHMIIRARRCSLFAIYAGAQLRLRSALRGQIPSVPYIVPLTTTLSTQLEHHRIPAMRVLATKYPSYSHEEAGRSTVLLGGGQAMHSPRVQNGQDRRLHMMSLGCLSRILRKGLKDMCG